MFLSEFLQLVNTTDIMSFIYHGIEIVCCTEYKIIAFSIINEVHMAVRDPVLSLRAAPMWLDEYRL
jgi:hypothetical protein